MEENNFQDLSFLKPEISVSAGETIQKDIQSKYKPTQSRNIGASVPSLDQIINSKADSRMSAYDSAPLLDIYKPLSSGEYVSMYESYMPGIDNQQRLAERQSTGEKWANGINKFIGKTTNAVVGGTVGILYGAGAALSDGNFSSVYDNKFSNWLNDLDTKMNYKLPNYYNRQEQEKGLFGQMGTANFWADKFLGGLSFTAGALISEGIWAYATGGTSLATSGARWANRLGRASRWGIEATEDIAKVTSATSKYKALLNSVPGQLYKTGVISKDAAIMAGKAGELASVGLFMGRSAGYEASVEALQYKKEAEEKFFSNFADINGREPNADDIAEFNKNLEKSANAVFGVNMAIVGSSNLVTMGHILDIKNPIKMGVSDFIDRKAFGYGVEKLANGTFKVLDPTRAQKITRGLFNYVVKPGVTEGLFEEGGQGVTTKTANKWIEHTYNPKYTNDNFDSIGAFYESVAEQYGTKEGWVENGLGILIGIVGGSINARSEGKAKEQELEMKASVANTFNDKTLQSILLPYKLQTANRISGFSEEAKEEAEKGNVTKSVLAQKSAVLSYVNAKLTLGDSIKDISKEMQKSLDLVTEEQWESMGIDVDNIEEHKSELISEYTNLAKQWKTNKTYWQYMIGRKFVGEKDLETTALEDVLGTPFNKNAAVVEALAWQSTIGENANLLMKDSLDKIGTELGQEQADALNLVTILKTQSKETRQEVSSSVLKYNALKQERDRLEKGIAELNVSVSATEGDKSKATKMAEKTNRLLELDAELNSLRDKIENITQNMLKADNYSKGLDELDFSQEIGLSIVSADSLLSINENIKKFESLLSSLESTNPQRLQYLNDLLDEYNQAEDVFLKSNASQKAILSKDFKIENIGSWLGGKLKRNKGMNENTQEWFQTALDDYASNKVKGVNYGTELEQKIEEEQTSVEETAQENNQETKPKTEEVKQEQPKTQLEIYKERLENLLKSSYNNLTYIGENYDGIANKKPTQAEIEEFKSATTGATFKTKVPVTSTSEVERIEIPRYFTFGELGGKAGKKPGETIETEKNRKIQENFEKQLKEGDKLIEPNGDVYFYKNGKVVKRNGQPRGLKDIGAFINGVTIERSKALVSNMETKKADIERKINSLPDDLLFITHITSDGNAINIYNSNLLMPAGVSSTTGIVTKEQLKQILFDLAEGKSPHRGYLDMFIGAVNRNTLENVAGKNLQDKLENYLDENFIEDVAKTQLPSSLNIGYFTNGILNTKYDVEQKTNEPLDKNSSRYQELKKKLSDWKLLDAAVDEEYVSIAEMVELINQLEQEVEVQDTKDEVTPQDIEEIKEEIEGTNITTDYTLLQNTQGTATVVKPANSDVYRLSHVKMATIVQSLNKPFTVKRKGKEIKPDLDKLQPNDVVIVDDMSLLYLPGGVIEIKIDDFRARQQALNMYIYDSGVKWTYKNIYTVKGNDFVKMPSDFSEDINSQEIYNQSKGDKLFLVVDDTDGFNETDFGGTKEQLKIFVTDSKGNKLSTLKALKQGTVNEDFLMLREEAFKRWEQAGKPSKMNLGIELEVDAVFLGSPQVTMSESFAPANIPITEKGAKNITATGYIEDGEVILNREIPEVNRSMVSKISKNNPGKKIPVVVIKKGAYNIVYPITMVKTPTPQLDLFDGIINSTIPNQEKVIRINNEIQKQGIQVEKLTYEDILDEVKVNRVREAFANKQTFVSADALSKREYKMSNLTKDAVINLDLEDLDNAISDAKIRVSFGNIIYKTERDLKNDNLIEVENQLNGLALELYRDYTRNASTKYLNSKGEIIEDIGYTDAFSDNEVIVAENNLQKLHNISVLRQAFSQKVPKSIENIIGAQKVREVKKLLDQYQFIKDQIAVKDSELKDGKKNADCK